MIWSSCPQEGSEAGRLTQCQLTVEGMEVFVSLHFNRREGKEEGGREGFEVDCQKAPNSWVFTTVQNPTLLPMVSGNTFNLLGSIYYVWLHVMMLRMAMYSGPTLQRGHPLA